MKIEIDTQTCEVKFNGRHAGRLEDLRYRPSLMTTQVAGSAADVILSGEAENMYLELRLSGFAVRDAGGAP